MARPARGWRQPFRSTVSNRVLRLLWLVYLYLLLRPLPPPPAPLRRDAG